jgi:taurine dioxygenase
LQKSLCHIALKFHHHSQESEVRRGRFDFTILSVAKCAHDWHILFNVVTSLRLQRMAAERIMGISQEADIARLSIGSTAGAGNFGATVSGLTQEHLKNPAIREELYELWIEKGLIIFKGLYGRDMLVELSAIFGELRPSPVREVAADDDPFIISIRYEPATGWLMNLNGKTVGSWQPWHTDGICGKYPNRGGIITPILMTTRDGETGFIDKIATYDSLPDEIKQEIEGLNAIYRMDPVNGFERPKFGQQSVTTIRYNQSVATLNKRLDDYPPVAHPLVHVQHETGRKALNLCPLFAASIEGVSKERSDELLRILVAHATAEELAYYHSYEPGDMVLWDNWRLLHCAKGSPPDEERIMERTTITGKYELAAA